MRNLSVALSAIHAKVSRVDLVVFFTSFTLLFAGIIASVAGNPGFFAICITVLNFIFILKFSRCIPLFILFSFIFLYTSTFNYFLVYNIPISFWGDFQTAHFVVKVLYNHALFIFFLGNFIPRSIASMRRFDYKTEFRPNIALFCFFFLAGSLILSFSLTGESLFEGGNYGSSDSVNKSTLHEYFILVFLFLLIYAPRKRIINFLIFILYLIYVVKTLLFGGRIEVVQITLLAVYLLYILPKKVSLSTVVLLLIAGVYISAVIVNIRSNPIAFIEGDLAIFNPSSILLHLEEVDFISSNEGDVIQSSARIVGLVENGDLTSWERLGSFICYVLSPFFPASVLPAFSNLATFKQDTYMSGGGGLISAYFYVWLGYCGPVFIAFVIAVLVRFFYRFGNKFLFIYGLCMFATFPRWFAYNPIFLIKFCLYSVFIYLLCTIFYNTFVKKHAFC